MTECDIVKPQQLRKQCECIDLLVVKLLPVKSVTEKS